MIIVQQVLLRRHKRLRYTWIRCSTHLSHGEEVILSNDEKWLVVEIFRLKKLKSEEDLVDLQRRIRVNVVKSGGSYEIKELNEKGRPKKNSGENSGEKTNV